MARDIYGKKEILIQEISNPSFDQEKKGFVHFCSLLDVCKLCCDPIVSYIFSLISFTCLEFLVVLLVES